MHRRTFLLPLFDINVCVTEECSDRCFPFGYLGNKFNCSDDVQKGADRMESITVIASLIICPFLPLFFSFLSQVKKWSHLDPPVQNPYTY